MFRWFGYDYEKTTFALAILLLAFSIPCFLFAYNFYFKSTFLFAITIFVGLILLASSIRFLCLLKQFKQISQIPKKKIVSDGRYKLASWSLWSAWSLMSYNIVALVSVSYKFYFIDLWILSIFYVIIIPNLFFCIWMVKKLWM